MRSSVRRSTPSEEVTDLCDEIANRLKASASHTEGIPIVASRLRTAATANPADRRTSPRLDFEVNVGLESDHNFYTGLTQDISSGGLFVATNQLKPVGERMCVRFTLPGQDQPIEVEAEVRWVRDPERIRTDAPPGMGLRFLFLTNEAKHAIAGFLRQRDSLYYDDE